MSDDVLTARARKLQAVCVSGGLSVATAESCTGGLVAHAITSVPGSSGYFVGGVVSYSDPVKASLLGVSEADLRAYGAVSAEVAAAMASGARVRLGADLAVSITGVAGPDGGTDAKPVGLTWIGLDDRSGHDAVRRFTWEGDRAENVRSSAAAALDWLLARATELVAAG